MDDINFNFTNALACFQHEQEYPYVLVRFTPELVEQLQIELTAPLRRCYITDQLLAERAAELGLSQATVLASRLPDQGATMAGDFGEILCYLYQSTKELPATAIGVKKWRLKQDRTKPAPKSDVVHFLMPNRPNPSTEDAVLCAEVKLKSTDAKTTPIASAIEDCSKDRTSRLAQTLVWLKERAMTESLGDVDIPLLDRFINLVDNPPIAKRYRAVAVICEDLLDAELQTAPDIPSSEFTLLIISVPNLKITYETVFERAQASAPT